MLVNDASWPEEGEVFQGFSNHIADGLLCLQGNDNIAAFVLYEPWEKIDLVSNLRSNHNNNYCGITIVYCVCTIVFHSHRTPEASRVNLHPIIRMRKLKTSFPTATPLSVLSPCYLPTYFCIKTHFMRVLFWHLCLILYVFFGGWMTKRLSLERTSGLRCVLWDQVAYSFLCNNTRSQGLDSRPKLAFYVSSLHWAPCLMCVWKVLTHLFSLKWGDQ